MEAEKLLAEPYLSKKPDGDQIKVVTAQENTIVAAGAGSGKTQTLATRFAYLVMSDEKNSVEKILTLTFTEKAAAEMYRRIYLTLKKFADELPECAEKNRAENAVKKFFQSAHSNARFVQHGNRKTSGEPLRNPSRFFRGCG